MALCASTASVGRPDWLVSDVNIYYTRAMPNSCVTCSGTVGSAHFRWGQIVLLCKVELVLFFVAKNRQQCISPLYKLIFFIHNICGDIINYKIFHKLKSPMVYSCTAQTITWLKNTDRQLSWLKKHIFPAKTWFQLLLCEDLLLLLLIL